MDPGVCSVGEDVTTIPASPDPPVSDHARRAAFASFYDRELPVQVRRAALLVGSVEAAHDAVHDAFVEVFRRWDGLDRPGPYLSVAVLNRCRDQARRLSTAERKLPLLVDRGGPEDEHLWDAIQALPFNHRAAIVLRYYHQLPEREILGCRPGSVGPWIQRGLRCLRKAVA
jgi:DNA-directed RNA polymerase specialized sigma24 family protein